MADKDDLPSGISRRNFLKSTGVASVAATIIAPAASLTAQSGPKEVGPGEVRRALMVNGRQLDSERSSRGRRSSMRCACI
jgi:hypothetical protein